MAVIHQLSPASARKPRFTGLLPMPDGSRRTFCGPDAHAVVEKWERARAEMEAKMQRKAARRLQMADYARRRREVLAAHGICQACGAADAEPGFTQCRACRLYNNQRRSGARTAPLSPYRNGRRAG